MCILEIVLEESGMKKIKAWNYVDRVTSDAFNQAKELGRWVSEVRLDILGDSHFKNENIMEDIAQSFVKGLLSGAEIPHEDDGDLDVSISLKLLEHNEGHENQCMAKEEEELCVYPVTEPPVQTGKTKKQRKLKIELSSDEERPRKKKSSPNSHIERPKRQRVLVKEQRYFSHGLIFECER